MKIGFFVGKFPYLRHILDYGGGEISAYNLAISLAKRGHQLYVFTTSRDWKDSIENMDGMLVRRYGTFLKFLRRNVSPSLTFKPLRHDVDVVHVHVGSSPIELVAALSYAKIKSRPLVATYHGDIIPSQSGLAYQSSVMVYNFTVKKVLDYADIIVSPSEHYVEESIFLKKYREKIEVIPNGINIENFELCYSKGEARKILGLPINENIVLFLGVLHPKKGPHVLLRAMRYVSAKYPHVKLVMCGDGIMREKLTELVKRLKISDYVKFTGFVNEHLKLLYYKAADIFVLPSIMTTEVFPLVLLEASASGLPMIVSDLKTFKCIIEDGWNGLFTKRDDYKSLADAIIYLLENEDLRKTMGRNAKEKVKAYSWEKIAEEYEKVYRKLVQ